MDVAGAAVGVASLGIQVCQGLLDYYQACESYHRDIQEAQKWIVHLQRTLVILGDVLQGANAKQDVFQNAQTGILNCEDGIRKLEKKLRKIHKDSPATPKERIKAIGHRLAYPLQQSTIAKLKEIVKDLFEHLLLSIQVLQVDTDFNTQSLALHINDTVASISASTTSLEGAARSQQAQMARLSDNVESLQSGTVAIRDELVGLPDQISQAVAGLLSTVRIGNIAKSTQLDQRSITVNLFDVLNWLKAPDPSAHHLRARKAHTPGTGQWLFETPEFKSWMSGRCAWLWISGSGGSGKTILCSHAIEHIANRIRPRRSEVIAYFYFSWKNDQEFPPYQTLLLSLIVQLVDRQGDLLPDLQDAFVQNDRHVGLLESIVLQLLHLQTRAYIVVDALDECPSNWCQRQNVLDGLHRLATAAKHVRILVTSRSEHNTEDHMQHGVTEALRLDQSLMQDDIRLHLNFAMGRAEFCAATASTRKVLETSLLEVSNGSIRDCLMGIEELAREPLRTDTRLLQASTALPRRLAMEALCTSKISSIADSNRESATSLLSWIVHARRPLTVIELMAVINTDPDSSDTTLETGADTIKRLLGAFADMLHISDAVTDRLDSTYHDQAQPTVNLVHQSVREYLLESGFGKLRRSSAPWDAQDAHATLAGRCVLYMSHRHAGARTVENPKSRPSPLLGYAVKYWTDHVERAQRADDVSMTKRLQDITVQAESLLQNNETMRAQVSSFTRNLGTLTFRPLESDIHADPSHDQIQSSSSHSSIRTHRLDAESRLVRCFTTPLQQACFKGNMKLVNRLIKRGANVNAQSGKFCSALHVAAYYGHVDTVTALLEAGANIDLEGGCFGTALQAAIAGDHDEVIDILLDRGADVNTSSAIAEPSDINENGPDYYDLPVKEMKRVTTG